MVRTFWVHKVKFEIMYSRVIVLSQFLISAEFFSVEPHPVKQIILADRGTFYTWKMGR